MPHRPICWFWAVLVALVYALSVLAIASPNHAFARSAASEVRPAVAAAVARAEALGPSLAALGRDWHAARTRQARATIGAGLKAAAEERAALLAGLIEQAPGEVLRLALPEQVIARLPAAAQEMVEERLTVDGTLTVKHVDYSDPALTHFVHVLETPQGERLTLHFAGRAPELLTGAEIRVTGVALWGVKTRDAEDTDGALAVADHDQAVALLQCCGTTTTTTAAVAPAIVANTFGEQKTLVLLVNFQNDPNNKPGTAQQSHDLVFGKISDFFRENSYGQAWLAGEVHGWLTLPVTSTCSDTVIRAEADAMAAAQGIDLASFGRIVYISPTVSCGGIAGQATIGGSPSRAFIYVFPNSRVTTHELGHNFGLYHSHGLNCVGAVIGSTCDTVDYGDRLDVMGSRELHINAFQKERLGWLGYGASPPIATVDVDGSVTLPPYEFDGPGPQALKVFRDIDPETALRRWFYLEFRQPIGVDAAMLSDPYLDTDNIRTGVVFHLGDEGTGLNAGNSSYLLDMTPDSHGDRFLDLDDSALVAGQVYSDSVAGISLATLTAAATGALVSVAFSAPDCVQASPLVALSPSESQWLAPGTAVVLTLTVTNNDNAGCAASTFNLSSAVPSGWSKSLASISLGLSPGASGSTTLTVTSPQSAADGYYPVTATATNAAATAFTASATATYVVSAATVNQTPVAVDDSAATAAATAIAIAVLGNDFDPDGDRLAVTAASQGGKGSVRINADGTVTYTPGQSFKGSDSFTYEISDGAAKAGAKVTVTAQKGGGRVKP